MVAILDDILVLFIVPGLMPYAGVIIGIGVGAWILDKVKGLAAGK